MAFLRKMKDVLNLECDNIQLKNGFRNFMKKYDAVRTKLNASGFGIDPDKDSSLDKGWIKKICPYFDLLDEVMNSRPNITPPSVLATAVLNEEIDNDSNVSINDPLEDNFEIRVESLQEADNTNVEAETAGQPQNSSQIEGQSSQIYIEECAVIPRSQSASPDPVTTTYVKQALSGLNLKKHDEMRGPLGIFAKVMGEKTTETMKIEKEKLQQNAAQFEINQEVMKERNKIELHKVNSQIELENLKLQLERERLADKKADRDHEILKLKLQQDFELRRLELLKDSHKN